MHACKFQHTKQLNGCFLLCITVAKTMSIKHDLLGMQRDGPLLKRGGERLGNWKYFSDMIIATTLVKALQISSG